MVVSPSVPHRALIVERCRLPSWCGLARSLASRGCWLPPTFGPPLDVSCCRLVLVKGYLNASFPSDSLHGGAPTKLNSFSVFTSTAGIMDIHLLFTLQSEGRM